MNYISNVFPFEMIENMIDERMVLDIWRCEPTDVPENCMSHIDDADTALLISSILGRYVRYNPQHSSAYRAHIELSLKPGDKLYVAQYSGPPIQRGAISLPDGAQLRWFKILMNVIQT